MASFGKHTRSPGFKSGDHWLVCDRCGFDIYSSAAMKEWNGTVVCPECFETRHPQDFRRGVHDNTAPKGLVRSEPNDVFVDVTYVPTAYLVLPGVSGDYASTPDVSALDIIGDIDIRVYAQLDNWLPSTFNFLVAKWAYSTQQSYGLFVKSTGLALTWTTDGASGTQIAIASTVAPSVSNGGKLWVRATLDVDNGASGYDVTFYTSSNGTTWTQLGTTVTGGSTTSIHSGTSSLTIGSDNSGTLNLNVGLIYNAYVYSGIDGTLVADFDPERDYASGTTMTSSTTGEVYTTNGGASIYSIVGDNTVPTGTFDNSL